VSVVLYRIDDRLIHGQVVVGWGQRLAIGFIVLVDDDVRAAEWEQELYRMGVPPGMELIFASVAEAVQRLPEWERDTRQGIVLTGDVDTMVALARAMPARRPVNLGGIHAREGRTERLRYVFLSPAEADKLKALAAEGVEVAAQDVPTAKPVPIESLV
jgi:PTS system mannose-specific IIB component/fructoselysine and glucoselysine-specific PTS system IIB component